jgi:C1A family cysteine protease
VSFKLGYIKDKADPRDKHFAALGLPAAIPAAVSLRDYVVEVLDQGNTSSCVAHSWAQALRIADMWSGVKQPALSSREYLYYNARAYDGGPIEDQGTQLRSCAQGIIKFGRPPESAWPFRESYVNERPPWEAYREGYDARGVAGYHRVSTLTEIRQAIAAGHAVVGGTDVGESIFTAGASGIYSPPAGEEVIGGHALCVTGYDAESFEIVNSWGPGWGSQGGFFRCSPAFMSGFTDLWIVSLQ